VSPVRYEQDFYTPEDGILHSHGLENLKSYMELTGWGLYRRRNLFLVTCELGILHSHRRENLKSNILVLYCVLQEEDF
jgi:hypothetical protein